VTFRILSYNIRHGGIGREQPIAAVIASIAPDIVVLEERRVLTSSSGWRATPAWNSGRRAQASRSRS